MKRTGLCAWAPLCGFGLASMASAQDATGTAPPLPSVESDTMHHAALPDTAHLRILDALLARMPQAEPAYLPAEQPSYGSRIQAADYAHSAVQRMSYTEQIAMLEEALRIARGLQAQEQGRTTNTLEP